MRRQSVRALSVGQGVTRNREKSVVLVSVLFFFSSSEINEHARALPRSRQQLPGPLGTSFFCFVRSIFRRGKGRKVRGSREEAAGWLGHEIQRASLREDKGGVEVVLRAKKRFLFFFQKSLQQGR